MLKFESTLKLANLLLTELRDINDPTMRILIDIETCSGVPANEISIFTSKITEVGDVLVGLGIEYDYDSTRHSTLITIKQA